MCCIYKINIIFKFLWRPNQICMNKRNFEINNAYNKKQEHERQWNANTTGNLRFFTIECKIAINSHIAFTINNRHTQRTKVDITEECDGEKDSALKSQLVTINVQSMRMRIKKSSNKRLNKRLFFPQIVNIIEIDAYIYFWMYVISQYESVIIHKQTVGF